MYLLKERITGGSKLPRWKPKTDNAAYVGVSDRHASSVPLGLRLDTGAIVGAYHSVCDDWFATVTSTGLNLPDLASEKWTQLFGDTPLQWMPDEEESVDDHVAVPDPLTTRDRLVTELSMQPHHSVTHPPTITATPKDSIPTPSPSANPPLHPTAAPQPPPIEREPSVSLPVSPLEEAPAPPSPPLQREETQTTTQKPTTEDYQQYIQKMIAEANKETPKRAAPATTPVNEPKVPSPTTKAPNPNPPPTKPLPVVAAAPAKRTRSKTAPAPTTRLTRSQTRQQSSANAVLFSDITNCLPDFKTWHNTFSCWLDNAWHQGPKFSYKAAKDDPDTFGWDVAMNSPERDEWIKSAQKEIDSLTKHGTWTEINKSEATSKIIPTQWVFRNKRKPSGELKSRKSRLVVRGDLQTKDANESFFAPVVGWPTVRLFLILALLIGWVTCSVDFSSAFVQSKIDKPTFIHLPRGFSSTKGPNTCLRLEKSLYGVAQAPKLWYNHISAALEDLGFKKSFFDECLFYRKDMMIVLYVDDAGIAAPRQELIDELVEQLRNKGFELTVEGSFAEFLGIKFESRKDGSIEMTQQGLIKKILKAMNLEECNPNWTPARADALGSDPEGELFDEDWNYRSIVGMMLYLSTNSRPDIAFAVSQVCRFGFAPKKSHGRAVKMIARYLARTSDKGTIVKPSKQLQLDLYCDADYAGLHKLEPDRNPNCAKSRGGYIIMLSGCPVVWKSSLIQEICLSTMESEYIMLSKSLRILLPLKRLLKEMCEHVTLPSNVQTTIKASVFEDNQAAFLLAKDHRLTNRTKYLLTKWHWFWSHYPKEFSIFKCDTKDQRADYMTKGLVRDLFENNRRGVQGW